MIEITIKKYLEEKTKKTVLLEHKENEPAQFFLIQKLGGGFRDGISNASFAIQSYANSKYECAVMNEDLKKAMLSAIELKDVSSVRLDSDYDYTDVQEKKHRYQAVYDIYYKD